MNKAEKQKIEDQFQRESTPWDSLIKASSFLISELQVKLEQYKNDKKRYEELARDYLQRKKSEIVQSK